ncbi:MAG: amidohydrolase family protein [Hyphomonadaceae bacterium]|nr:amidohydrolase family protein [Hyphomonadaceae bacterium]
MLSRRHVLASAAAAAVLPAGAAYGDARRRPLAIERVTLASAQADKPALPDALIVVRDGKIEYAGPRAGRSTPSDAKRIDGQGKWAIPALIDMHVHAPQLGLASGRNVAADPRTAAQDALLPYLANGIQAVFNLSGTVDTMALGAMTAAGFVDGPAIINAALIDGSPPVRPGTRVAATAEAARAWVSDIAYEGYRFVKVYSRLELNVLAAIIDEARKQNLRVVGHIPNSARGQIEKALVPGFDMVAHAEEFAKQSPELSDADISRFAALSRASGTKLIATLTCFEWIARQTRSVASLDSLDAMKYLPAAVRNEWRAGNPYARNSTPERIERFDRFVDFHRRLVKAFRVAGVPVLAGTDSMIPGLVPGFSLHDELESLVAAGISSNEALAAATVEASAALGLADTGVLEAGKRANILLLDADPNADIRNSRRINGFVREGAWIARADLDKRLAGLAKRNA